MRLKPVGWGREGGREGGWEVRRVSDWIKAINHSKKEAWKRGGGGREGEQHTCGTGTKESSACRGVRGPGSEGLSARQRDAGKEERAGRVAAKGLGLASLCLPSRDAGTTGRAGRERGKEGEQDEQEEDEEEGQEEEQVVVREEWKEEEEE